MMRSKQREPIEHPVDGPYHIFFSYARVDNARPVDAEGSGWITAFERELRERHRRYSGKELRIFFDKEAIEIGVDWKRRLAEGIRQSRLLLAFLSPNYLTSPNCLWEWEEYLRREHSAARGDDGLTPIFFVTPRDLSLQDDQRLVDWLEEMRRKYAWLEARSGSLPEGADSRAHAFTRDLHRRNRTTALELQPWFERGPEILKQLDAAERSEAIQAAPRDPGEDTRTLRERLEAIDRHIASRLDRITLAGLAPGNVSRSHEHFVGRHRELSDLQTILVEGGPQSGGRGMGGRGMIAAPHGPGGLGKTALARQYAHAYAEFYAAGGTWEVPCEGATTLGAALLKLTEDAGFLRVGAELGHPLVLSDAQREDYALAARAVFDHLEAVTHARVDALREELRAHPERHSQDLPAFEQPRALLILDNVDRPELLGAEEIAQIPPAEWLELIVTTRLDPGRFGGGARTFGMVEVDVLPEPDALQLIRDFQPGHRFANDAEEAAAGEIVHALGGYTLAIELVAAYLGTHADGGFRPAELLERFRQGGLLGHVDSLSGSDPGDPVAAQIRHEQKQKQVGTLLEWSVARLSPPARTALEFASLLQPDAIPMSWLQILTRVRHPEAMAEQAGYPSPWGSIWSELHGLRLLHPSGRLETDDRAVAEIPEHVRLHRLVGERVVAANPALEATWDELDQMLDQVTTLFEQQVGQGDDAWLRAQHPMLRDQLAFLIRVPDGTSRRVTPSLLTSAGVAASFEGEHGTLARAIEFTAQILIQQERLLLANPESALAARDVSASLQRLGAFLASRGLPR